MSGFRSQRLTRIEALFYSQPYLFTGLPELLDVPLASHERRRVYAPAAVVRTGESSRSDLPSLFEIRGLGSAACWVVLCRSSYLVG